MRARRDCARVRGFPIFPKMKHFHQSRSLQATLLVATVLAVVMELTPGAAQVFTVDTNKSSVTISGIVIGGTIMSQAPGSLTAAIGGTIKAAVTGSSIQFTGQSQILAETNGSWQPKSDGTTGSEPGDFGAQANLGFASGYAALRQIQLDVFSPAMSVTGGQFNSTNLTFQFSSNALSALDYIVSGLVNKHGAYLLTGYATNKVTSLGSITTSGNQQVLSIPVDATFYLSLLSANDTTIRLQGQLVAAQSAQGAFTVQPVTVSNQKLVLQWQANPGTQVQVQSTTNFSLWQTNATIVTPASGAYGWTGAISGPVRFFRLAK